MSARSFYSFIIFSLAFAVMVSMYLVGGRSEKHVYQLIEQTTDSRARLAAINIDLYLGARISLLQDIAAQPAVASSVLGSEYSLANLSDLLDGFRFLGIKESILLTDILGEVLYSNDPQLASLEVDHLPWFKKLINNESAVVVTLYASNDTDRFLIAVPVKYNQHAEGVLITVLRSSIASTIKPSGFETADSVELNGDFLSYSSAETGKNYRSIAKIPIDRTGLSLTYLVDQDAVNRKKVGFMRDMGMAILGSLLVTFGLLAVIGRDLVLNPFKALSKSQQEAQNALERSNMLTQAIEASPLGISIAEASPGYPLIYINDGFVAMTGYDRLECLGKNCRFLQGEETDPDQIEKIRQALKNQEKLQVELINYRKDGQRFWNSLLISPVYNREGELSAYLGIQQDVSERKYNEELLYESNRITSQALMDLKEQKFALDQHALVAITDLHGTITFANQKFSEISGFSQDELLGKNHRILNSGYHSKSFFAEMYQVIGQGKVWHGEICNRNKQGGLYWVDTTIVPFKNSQGKPQSYIAIRTDITELKQVQSEIANKNLRMELATNAAGIGIWEWDVVNDVLLWDDWMYRLYGVSPSAFSGAFEAWVNGLHPEDKEKGNQAIADALRDKGSFDTDFRVIHPNDEVHTLKAFAHVITDDAGNPTKMIGVNYDITARIQYEYLLKEARDEAREAAQAKSAFLANMSHEIRTPMNGVLGMLSLVINTQLSDEQRHRLKIVESSAKSLLTILNDILDFSKIEAGKLDLENVSFNLQGLISECAEAMTYLVREDHQVEIVLDMVGLTENSVKGDPGRLRQIFTNLIGNAIKFTQEGEIVVRAKLETLDEHHWMMTGSVADTGIGIPAEKLNTLFQEFSQVDVSTTRKYGGTGLGLAITRSLCELMGGGISVSSESGNGSVFEFQVMLNKATEQPGVLSGIDIAGLQMLVVDDNATNREVLREQLKCWDVVVTEACNGADAVACCERYYQQNNSCFDVALIDMQMPEMDGKTLGQYLKQEVRFCNTKLIMMASMVRPGDAKLFASLGFTAYLAKPAAPQEILAALKAVVEDSTINTEAAHLVTSRLIDELARTREDDDIFERGYRILLVEDNPVNQQVAMGMVEALGLPVTCANNGRIALECLKASVENELFDLVLMDCQMPEMDGYETTRRIRNGEAGERYKDITVVAMTANAMKGDRENCLAAGMNDYLVKPIDSTVLKRALLDWLAPHHASVVLDEVRIDSDNRENVIWDEKQALKRVRDKPDRLRELLRMFLVNVQTQFEALDQAVDAADINKVRKVAHSIKGSAGNLACIQLENMAAALELAGYEESFEQITMLIPQVKAAFEDLCAVLSANETFTREE